MEDIIHKCLIDHQNEATENKLIFLRSGATNAIYETYAKFRFK